MTTERPAPQDAGSDPRWAAIIDDAAMFPPGDADPADAARDFAARTRRPEAALVGSLVLADTALPSVPTDAERPLTVSLVITGGAGQVAGPAALCRRQGHRLAGVEIALRDLDDLAGNARRVVAAVDAARASGDLADDVPVHVELPQAEPGAGWLRAADEVAAAELLLKFRTGGTEPHQFPPAAWLAAWVDAALDRETPFKLTAGLHGAVRRTVTEPHLSGPVDQHGFVNVLLATRLAFDGAGRDEVVAALEERDRATVAARAGEGDLAGARRWFRSFGSCSVDEPVADLRDLGLLA